MININSSRILKTFIYCMAILTLVSCLVFLIDLNFKFEDPRNIKGKSISFLGDSITTFEGYSNIKSNKKERTMHTFLHACPLRRG